MFTDSQLGTVRNTTRWLDTPIVPVNYESLADLRRLARKARGANVGFDWVLNAVDLRRLREAVH